MKPKKKRTVLYPPHVQFFKPQGIQAQNLNSVSVTVDEYEAVRLTDHEKLKHEEAAKKMNISRPTFTRLLESAHGKISDALVNGKAIRIEGGDFRFSGNRYRCRICGYYWNIENVNHAGGPADVNHQADTRSTGNSTGADDAGITENYETICPNCKSPEFDNLGEKIILQGHRGKMARRGHGWNKNH